jgi:hypothetical protein
MGMVVINNILNALKGEALTNQVSTSSRGDRLALTWSLLGPRTEKADQRGKVEKDPEDGDAVVQTLV